jgi:hypothetical protein
MAGTNRFHRSGDVSCLSSIATAVSLRRGCERSPIVRLSADVEGVRMMMKNRIVIAAAVALCLGGSAIAAEPAPAAKPAASAPSAKPAAAPAKALPKRTVGDNSASKAGAKPRTAISLDCSKQADAKGLHGKPREKFRNDCKKGK